MEQPAHVLRLRAIAQRYDIEGLRDEINAALEGLPEVERAFVPITLAAALDRFYDSYVRHSIGEG